MLLRHEWQYYVLQACLSFAGTGTFAFGRSILSDLTPKRLSAQVFGFFTSVMRTAGTGTPSATR